MLKNGKAETVNALALEEGEATWGVYLPLALARIYAAIETQTQILIKVNSRGAKISPVKLKDVLRGFCLPALSEAVGAEETAAEEKQRSEMFTKIFERFS